MKLNQYIAVLPLLLLLSGCKVEGPQNTLSGNGEKTPIQAAALLDGGSPVTRAADMSFDVTSGDQLVAYLRHVKWDGTTGGTRTLVNVQNSPKLVAFTATGNTLYTGDDIKPIGLGGDVVVATKTGNVTNQATTLTATPAIYWDDFSANDANDNTESSLNIRETGHYLQSYYGYCYNGGTPLTGATLEDGDNKTTGTIGWAVSTVQNDGATKSAFKTSDLLWSAEQTPIKYAHVDGQGNRNHGTLILPYTHAMSKVTIKVTLHESFGDGADFRGVTTTLHEMFTTCTCTAPTYTLSAKGTAEDEGQTTDIIMWNGNTATEKITTCTFEAIVVPSILSVVNNFATITGLDGNTYVIPTTEKMLQKGSEHSNLGWGDQLTETDEHINNGTAQAPMRTSINRGKGYEMKSGVNYVLNVTISKQQITVSALIKDWTNVKAEGTALVQFTSDVNGKGDIAEALKTGGFDVYKNSVNTAFDTKTTTLTWSPTYSKWEYAPVIYWAGQGDASYFRALSPMNQGLTMNQGTDMLWGYACDDDANNGSKVGTESEVKITPRTGDVPLHFEHPMSKISVKLETPEGTPSDATSNAVNLTGARIEISNIAKTGTLELVKGSIEPGSITAGTAIDGSVTATATASSVTTATTSIANLLVIPQTITDESILKITLSDGTVYKLRLNTCVDSGSTADPKPIISAWQRGRHYTYTIHVEKEAITFRAMIKDWVESNGGGNATLEWD